MSTCPAIVIYVADHAVGAEIPDAMMFCAAMIPDKREGSHWMATGPTQEAARAKLEAMWAKEHPEPTEKQRAAWAKKKAAAPVDDDDDLDVVL